MITKDLKKLGYDSSPRNNLPFAGMGASGAATGFDVEQAMTSQSGDDPQAGHSGVEVI